MIYYKNNISNKLKEYFYSKDKTRNYTAFTSQDTEVFTILLDDYLEIF